MRLRHYRVRKGRGYWEPTARMKALGFRLVALGPNGPDAWAKAERLNADWDKARRDDKSVDAFEPGTMGALFHEYRTMGVWARKEPRTREEWEESWKIIKPVFGDVLVVEIGFQACDAFYCELVKAFSIHKKHRVFKIFRALLEVAIGFKLISENPTHRIANTAPKGRTEIWCEVEIGTLRDAAWERGYRGLAVAIAVAYDTQMSPVDVRKLALSMRRSDHFETQRAKTGRKVIATITAETSERIDRYLAAVPFIVPPDQPFIRNRSGHVYTKDTLSDDFRAVRNAVFPGDTRRLMDLRRTGNVEAIVGGAEPPQLAAKLSNTISQTNSLFDIYGPTTKAAVMEVDKARTKGRRLLQRNKIAEAIAEERISTEENKSGNFPTPATESELAPKATGTDDGNKRSKVGS